jgi:hypothetical protein
VITREDKQNDIATFEGFKPKGRIKVLSNLTENTKNTFAHYNIVIMHKQINEQCYAMKKTRHCSLQYCNYAQTN